MMGRSSWGVGHRTAGLGVCAPCSQPPLQPHEGLPGQGLALWILDVPWDQGLQSRPRAKDARK